MHTATTPAAPPPGDFAAFTTQVEASLLGCCLIGAPQTAALVQALRTPKRFGDKRHRAIFTAIQALVEGGEHTPDLVLLTDRLMRDGALQAAGGPFYVASLTDDLTTAANAPYYLGVVLDAALRRGMALLASKMSDQAADPTVDVFDQMAAAGEFMETLRRELLPPLQHTAATTLATLQTGWEERRGRLGAWDIPGIPSGFARLDSLTGGWQPGQLIVLGARPGQGKSTLAVAWAYAAIAAGSPVAFFSLEMTAAEVTARYLARACGVCSNVLTKGVPTAADAAAIAAIPPEHLAGFIIQDTSGLTPRRLQDECRRLHRQAGARVFIIDYLQLLGADAQHRTRNDEVAATTRLLKELAMELEATVIALSQLSRVVEQSHPPIPKKEHLRDSGAIEQDANIVLLLWRPEVSGYPEHGAYANLIIAKSRDGALGEMPIRFEAIYPRYTDPDDPFSNEGLFIK